MREAKVARQNYYVRDDGTVRLTTGKITKGSTHKASGYRNIQGSNVHRLVAIAFVHNPRPDLFTIVDHVDHDRLNNHHANLRWVSANYNRRKKLGRCVTVNQRKKGLTYTVVARGVKQRTFDCELKALQYVHKNKKEYLEKLYEEELVSEPKYKSVGVQCTLCT